jgi:hypothetical protein
VYPHSRAKAQARSKGHPSKVSLQIANFIQHVKNQTIRQPHALGEAANGTNWFLNARAQVHPPESLPLLL